MTEAELAEQVRQLLVRVAHPEEEGYCEVPVLEVSDWPGLGVPLDGWPQGVNPDVILGLAKPGSTPETYGHLEAERMVAAIRPPAQEIKDEED